MTEAIPRWVAVLVGALPGLGWIASLVLVYALRVRVLNLSLRDSLLIVSIGGILASSILALLIICIALMRALRRAPR